MKKVIQINATPLEALWLTNTHTLAHAIVGGDRRVGEITVKSLENMAYAIQDHYPGGMPAFVDRINDQLAALSGIERCHKCNKYHAVDTTLDIDQLIRESLP